MSFNELEKITTRGVIDPILAQCSISIPPENFRKSGFPTFSGGTEIEHLPKMG